MQIYIFFFPGSLSCLESFIKLEGDLKVPASSFYVLRSCMFFRLKREVEFQFAHPQWCISFH